MVMAETQLSPESRLALSFYEEASEPARTPPPAFPFLHDPLCQRAIEAPIAFRTSETAGAFPDETG